MQPSQNNKNIFFFLCSLILLLLVYNSALHANFFSTDDVELIKAPQIQKAFEVASIKSVLKFGNSPDYYPVRDLSYMLDQYFWNSNPYYSRIHQLVLFWFSSVVLFLVFINLKIQKEISFLMSQLWLFHPVHAETILWLSARKDVLALLFAMAAVNCYLNYNLKNKLSSLWWACLFYGFSILSKASFALLPFVFVVANLLKIEKKRDYLPKSFALTLCISSVIFQNWYYVKVNNMERFLPLVERFQTSLVALGRMALGWFTSKYNAIDIFNHGSWLQLNWGHIYLGIFLWCILFIALFWFIKQKNQLGIFFLLCLLLIYLPVSNLIFPHQIFYSARYMEPLGVTLFIFIVYIWRNSIFRKRYLGILIIVCLYSSYLESHVWSSNIKIREKALSLTPQNIKLKTLLLSDKPNDILQKDIENTCNWNLKDITLNEDCALFYYREYYSHRENHNTYINDKYFERILTAQKHVRPQPKALERLQIDHMLFSGKFNQILAEEWLQSHPYLLTEGSRSVQIILSCLLGEPARNLEDNYISQNLLLSEDFKNYIYGNVNESYTEKLRMCQLI